MKLLILTLLALCVSVNCLPLITDSQVEEAWQKFKRDFKSIEFYENSDEESMRRQIFERNFRVITKHNAEADNGLHKYRMAVNKFADMTDQEYRQYLNLDVSSLKGTQHKPITKANVDVKALPKSKDWRDENVVTPVKDQGQCGSCFAFSTVDTIESQHAIKTGKLVRLSPQNVVDCIPPLSRVYDTCQYGHLMHLAFEFIIKEGGLDTESHYPYHARVGRCNYQKQYSGASITGYVNITSGDEQELQQAVATVGPVVVGINADTDGFKFYDSGVYVDEVGECGSDIEDLHHAVVAIGYGVEDGQDYWLLKNSWGVQYGDAGLMKMARNNDNQCGISTYAMYPTGASL